MQLFLRKMLQVNQNIGTIISEFAVVIIFTYLYFCASAVYFIPIDACFFSSFVAFCMVTTSYLWCAYCKTSFTLCFVMNIIYIIFHCQLMNVPLWQPCTKPGSIVALYDLLFQLKECSALILLCFNAGFMKALFALPACECDPG